jgi:hypothetical protein
MGVNADGIESSWNDPADESGVKPYAALQSGFAARGNSGTPTELTCARGYLEEENVVASVCVEE